MLYILFWFNFNFLKSKSIFLLLSFESEVKLSIINKSLDIKCDIRTIHTTTNDIIEFFSIKNDEKQKAKQF